MQGKIDDKVCRLESATVTAGKFYSQTDLPVATSRNDHHIMNGADHHMVRCLCREKYLGELETIKRRQLRGNDRIAGCDLRLRASRYPNRHLVIILLGYC